MGVGGVAGGGGWEILSHPTLLSVLQMVNLVKSTKTGPESVERDYSKQGTPKPSDFVCPIKKTLLSWILEE